MSTEKILQLLENLKKTVKKSDIYYADTKVKTACHQLFREAIKSFPDHIDKIKELKKKTMDRSHGPFGSDILQSIKAIEKFTERKVQKEMKENKTFLNPSDLIKQAGLALRQGNEAYSINLCDSAIESFLRDIFDVPSTVVGQGSVKFLSECMILNIPAGMDFYLKEVKNKVCQMNNQIKHKGYIPTRLDAINALKVTEELYDRRNRFKDLPLEEKRKIQEGIGLRKE